MKRHWMSQRRITKNTSIVTRSEKHYLDGTQFNAFAVNLIVASVNNKRNAFFQNKSFCLFPLTSSLIFDTDLISSLSFWKCSDDIGISGISDGQCANTEVFTASCSQLNIVAIVMMNSGLCQHSLILDEALSKVVTGED